MLDQIPLLSVGEVNRLANEILSKLTVRVIGELDERFDIRRGYGIGKLKDSQASIDIYIPYNIVKSYKDCLVLGNKIVCEGRLGIYEKYGKYSLTVSAIEPHGEGVLQRELEKLKRQLAKLGYFDIARKRSIPQYPTKIGVITGKNSAAWSDFKKHVTKEYAGLTIYLHDALMQGAYCIDSVCGAFDRLAKEKLDIIVLTRGGGSLQDLMPFNSQEIVEAIVKSPFPVITAIGHEIDMTLADFAADRYVSTPTKAAEIIAQKYAAVKTNLAEYKEGLRRTQLYYKNLPIELDSEQKRLKQAIRLLFKNKKQVIKEVYTQLVLLSPKGTLKRGYSITFDKNGKIIRDTNKLSRFDIVKTSLFKGEFISIIDEISN